MRAAVTSTGKKNKCRAKANSVFPNVTTHTVISAFPAGCSSFSENLGIAEIGGTSGNHQGLCPRSRLSRTRVRISPRMESSQHPWTTSQCLANLKTKFFFLGVSGISCISHFWALSLFLALGTTRKSLDLTLPHPVRY